MVSEDTKLLCITNLIGKLSDEEVAKVSERKKRVTAAIQTFNLIVSQIEAQES